ncbi:MAG: hypothetical protein PF961_11105 [Planctomycetota bacterium]|jgi:hypothetical protein|nr:hypothetical protein [Planctomycetota bacterium]
MRALCLIVCCLGIGAAELVDLVEERDGKRYPIPVAADPAFVNQWPDAEEARFMDKAAHLIAVRGTGKMGGGGSTVNEREKELYPTSMFWILAGREAEGVANLQAPQRYDPKEHHAYTDGFDFWYGFTLKGQMRKYFLFGGLLDDDYRTRFEAAFAKWTVTDPRETPHPFYMKYDHKKQGWTPERFGNRQLDGRRTDNLYAMSTCATYLFAEAAGNEETRLATWNRIREYGTTMYMNGIGEWDSENYLSHTMSAYINLYDFAQDPMVKMHAKGMLDWISAAMAVKYWRGGWAGSVKRDYGNMMALDGNSQKCAHLYYDDIGLACDGDRDDVHHITSSYRPPMAAVALAQGRIDAPIELSISHPTYENWKTDSAGRSGRDFPEFIETFMIGHSYRLGTLPFGNGGDVNGFKMITYNSKRGTDYFVVGHGAGQDIDKLAKKNKTSTRGKMVSRDDGNSNVAQFRNLVIDVSDNGAAEFFVLVAPGGVAEQRNGIQFVRHEKTWIALTPINLSWSKHADGSRVYAEAGDILHGLGKGGDYSGFAMEVGEAETHGDYASFVAAVVAKSKLSGTGGEWGYTGSQGHSVGLKHVGGKPGMMVNKADQAWVLDHIRSAEEVLAAYPVVTRDGEVLDWTTRFAQYQRLGAGDSPISLGFKQGVLRLQADGHRFTGTMTAEGVFSFSNE